ncbi:MAG: UDP-N-acetylmuramate dehydrogenase [Prevotella sp.]|nr:UDP-N-acetylmuramate dehydrogenase [Prevotella sp.]
MKDIRNYNLLNHNTFGIDANCRRFIEFSTVGELQAVCKRLTDADQPLLLLGGGSNLLLTGDFDGTVLHSAIKGIEKVVEEGNSVLVRAGSGETWDDFVAFCLEKAWFGAENLSLIPGEVGASAVQNIGAYGVEAKDIIECVEAVEIATGRRVTFENDEIGYSYRQSRFKQDWKNRFVITHVIYRLSTEFVPQLDYGNLRQRLSPVKNGDISDLKASPSGGRLEGASTGGGLEGASSVRQAVIDIRREKLPDPKILGNGGSFFVNPIVPVEKYRELAVKYPEMPHYEVDSAHVKIPAGWLIEQCAWKGRSRGRAGVYEKQALVLVNLGGATGQEIIDLCRQIQHDVKQKFGIEIKPEVNII